MVVALVSYQNWSGIMYWSEPADLNSSPMSTNNLFHNWISSVTSLDIICKLKVWSWISKVSYRCIIHENKKAFSSIYKLDNTLLLFGHSVRELRTQKDRTDPPWGLMLQWKETGPVMRFFFFKCQCWHST